VLQPNGFMPAAPYRLEDNPDTLLDRSDIVMVDAMSTGYSRAATAELTKKFLGVKGDVLAFGEFIRLYLSRYDRWNSPLFPAGGKLRHDARRRRRRIFSRSWHSFQRRDPALDGRGFSDAGVEQIERPALHCCWCPRST
jgi:hypothetical protein